MSPIIMLTVIVLRAFDKKVHELSTIHSMKDED